MTRDPRSKVYDDAAIEQLVRDVAGEWNMPPVRLDAPSWRERVRSPRTRRLAAAGGWFGRVGQAATAAVALTVVGALIAVVITRPSALPGKSSEPSSGAGPTPTAGARSTPLPKHLVTGEDPDPAILVLRSERGDFSRVDLTTGEINTALTGKSSYSDVLIDESGAMVCLCVEESGSIGNMPTDNIVTLDRFDSRGKLVSTTPIDQFSGEPDPRDEGVLIPEHPAHVLTKMGFSDDGRYGYVGWSVRAHPVWKSGIVVVDLRDGSVVSRLALPDDTDGEGNSRRVVSAPEVVGSVGSDTVIVARGWYQWTPPASQQAMYISGNKVFRVGSAGGSLSDPTIVASASDCGNVVNRAGGLPGGGLWVACTDGGPGKTLVRRLRADTSLMPDVVVSGSVGVETDPTALSADGKTLYVWDPVTTNLSRIDLASGERTSGKGIAMADGGPLTAFGNWLAPTAAAKSWLHGALVISPDGTRVYAIGTKTGLSESEMAGSTGVFVFDASTLAPLAVWQPIADYVSIAVSADNRFVYASGLPGIDVTGRPRIGQQASITVFDTSDGSIRLIAGRLGGDALTFLSGTLR